MIAALFFAATLANVKTFAGFPLESALQKAVSTSPDVAQARARVDENTALLGAARGGAAPQLMVDYSQSPQAGNGNATITQRLYTVGSQFALGDFLSLSPSVRQAVFALSGAQFDLLDAQRSERIKTSQLYFDALKAQAAVNLRAQDLAGTRQDLRVAEARFRAGDAPRLDVVRAQVALESARTALDAAQVDLANAQDALSVETGEPVQTFSRTVSAPVRGQPVLDPKRAVDRALALRSDLRSAEQAVEAEHQAVRLAQRGEFPTVTIGAGYTTGTDTGIPIHGPSASVNVALPISHAAADRVNAERARLAQAEFKEASVRREIRTTVAAAARTYEESVRAAEAAARARDAAEKELAATQVGYRGGASSSLDVSDARRTYVQAALNELNALYAQAEAAATLEQETGP